LANDVRHPDLVGSLRRQVRDADHSRRPIGSSTLRRDHTRARICDYVSRKLRETTRLCGRSRKALLRSNRASPSS